jgi:hypothetical protein
MCRGCKYHGIVAAPALLIISIRFCAVLLLHHPVQLHALQVRRGGRCSSGSSSGSSRPAAAIAATRDRSVGRSNHSKSAG